MKQQKEIWRDVAGYEELYEISDFGRVRRKKSGRVLKPWDNGDGYLVVGLRKNGVRKAYTVHRLVAIAFLPNPHNYPCINHKDETRDNNHVENLEWCSNAYNLTYGSCQKRRENTLKRRYGRSGARPPRPVICIELDLYFPSTKSAEWLLGRNYSALSRVIKKGYRLGGYHWKYAEVE